MKSSNYHIDFSNTQIAFHLKTDADLERAYFLFKMISNQPLVRIGAAATQFALKSKLPVEGLIKSTVFDHFCGGVNESDCMTKIDRMHDSGVYSVLDYSVEGKQNEAQFDSVVEKTLEIISFAAKNKAIPFAVFKPTALGRFNLYEKVSKRDILTLEENKEWERIKTRFHIICKFAQKMKISVLVDAEESWIQDSADDLLLDLMKVYNKESVVVYNTIQAYRKNRLEYLKELDAIAKKGKFKLGFKLVRGAYMEKERKHAETKNIKSPICKTKSKTDTNFDNCLIFILKNLSNTGVFIGTHNEKSTLLALKTLSSLNIKSNDSRVWFGQLYGMSDHISFNLAKHEYNVAKYLPFGPVKDVMPYLIRRAEENTSVTGQTNRELELIKKEKKRRNI